MPLVSGVCRKASAPKLSHGGSRLNASKPEANPKTRSPTHTLITKNLSSTLYNPSTAATPHTRSQRGEGALDFPNFCNSSDRFCAITRRKGRKPFIIQPKATTQYQLTSVFLTVHSARVFLSGEARCGSLNCETTKLYRIAIYKKVGLCLALAQSISMITRHTQNAIQNQLFGILKNTGTGKHA